MHARLKSRPLTRWIDTWKTTLNRWRGGLAEIDLEPLWVISRDVTAQGADLADQADDDLRLRAAELRSQALAGSTAEALEVDIFALVREAAHRSRRAESSRQRSRFDR